MKINQTRIYRFLISTFNKYFPITLAKLRFKKMFHRNLNLKSPQDINEKILYLSLFSDTTEWSRLADKYAVRKYVEDCGLGEILVKLYGKWDNVENIDWSILPNSFVMKTNNGSGTVLIVKDKSNLNLVETNKLLRNWLNKEVAASTTEFHYKRIKPCIIAEEYLESSNEDKKISSTLIDYKIWCFNGKPYSIWTCANRNEDSTEVALFDKDWNYHPECSVFNKHYRESKNLVPKPKKLKEMLEVAEKLSHDFPVLRVDLYNVNNKIYFGELTFTSLGGTMDFYTQEYLLEMGRNIDLSLAKLK